MVIPPMVPAADTPSIPRLQRPQGTSVHVGKGSSSAWRSHRGPDRRAAHPSVTLTFSGPITGRFAALTVPYRPLRATPCDHVTFVHRGDFSTTRTIFPLTQERRSYRRSGPGSVS